MIIRKIDDLDIKENENNLEIRIKVKKDEHSLSAADSLLSLYYSDIPVSADISPRHSDKSPNAHNYAWHLISEIAKSITSTKEEVYKQLIKDYGVSAVVTVKAEAFEAFANEWAQNGLGYFVEIIDGDEENINAFLFKGLSAYSQRDLNYLMNGIIYEANSLGIDVRTRDAIDKYESSWRSKIG